MNQTFVLPGTSAPTIAVHRSLMGGVSLLIGDQPVPRSGRMRPVYLVPLPDGTTRELRIRGGFTGLKVIVDGAEIPLERPLRPYELLLVGGPLVLVLGGALGGLIGALAALVNARMMRSEMRAPVKIGAALSAGALAVLIWFGAASSLVFLISPLPEFAPGNCLNISTGDVVSASTPKVDCAIGHRAEVVATVDYPGSTSYPGETALTSFTTEKCIPAFATYVGIPFERSDLEMFPIVPSEATWGKGDHAVTCIVDARDGSSLVGSVRGAAR